MGNSHFKSNIVGYDGTQEITNFATIGDTSAAVVGASAAISGAVTAGTYIRVGTKKYIFFSSGTLATTIVKNATSVSASVKGSITLGAGSLWVHTSDTAASKVSLP